MSRLSRHRILLLGILSPLLALICHALVYATLTLLSSNHEKDWIFRLSVSTIVMVVPLIVVLILLRKEPRPLSTSTKAGLAFAALSLGLAWHPISDGMLRFKQMRNLSMHDVPAPLFDTADISGQAQHLADQKGKVVLVSLWATWCPPCRTEMPKLDHLYQERKQQGLVVFGLSAEDADTQQKFVQQIPVTYPLLTVRGNVPDFYRDIVRYPSFILIDQAGRLQVAPAGDQPFEKVQVAVDTLLARDDQ
jgi:thiol-disulfide isomerase/thioredoxin